MKTKVKPNRYKPDATRDTHAYQGTLSIDFCLKWIMLVASISLLSLASIFVYDLVTQSSVLNVKHIEISGNDRVTRDEIISSAGLDTPVNIFKINTHAMEKKIASNPWIESAQIHRNMSCGLSIAVTEHKALAIVKIENIAEIIINTKGRPFKEYDPGTDHLDSLPVITGLDLTRNTSGYIFDGLLFNAVMKFLNIADLDQVISIHADDQIGLTVETQSPQKILSDAEEKMIPVKMGFNKFKEKMNRAKTISAYMDKYFPDKKIIAMDLFNLKKVFVKTKLYVPGLKPSEKGV